MLPHIQRAHQKTEVESISLFICCHIYWGHIKKWMLTTLEDAQVESWECPWEDMVCNIKMKAGETLWSLIQGQNTNTTTTFTCYLCWSMLLQNGLFYDEMFGLMKLSYLQCHIMLYSSKGTCIRISSFPTSEYRFDIPSESYSEFDHENDNIRMD